MKVLTADEMRRMEAECGLPSPAMMEAAGLQVAAFAARLLEGEPVAGYPGGPVPLRPTAPLRFPALRGRGRGKVAALTGKGNNGGDGQVALRHLYEWGYAVVPPEEADLVIDALLGTGVRGPAREPVAAQIERLNALGKPVLALDLPSGVETDSGRAAGAAVRAAWTLALSQPKWCHVLHPGAALCGETYVAPIGIPAAHAAQVAAEALTPARVRGWLPRLSGAAHKGTRGRVLVIAGSRDMSGAGVLSALAVLRVGAGVCTLAVPRGVQAAALARLVEVMTMGLPETAAGGFSAEAVEPALAAAARMDAVAIGPGLGRAPETLAFVRGFLARCPCPVVADADALQGLGPCASPLVITPHTAEMARLLGMDPADVEADRRGAVAQARQSTGAVVLLKGPFTLVDDFINTSGGRALATAGAGDVLTGAIAGLLAQGLAPVQAAAAGAFLHGLAADRLSARLGADGILAGDLLAELPLARRQVGGE